jgi:hypothetical protein
MYVVGTEFERMPQIFYIFIFFYLVGYVHICVRYISYVQFFSKFEKKIACVPSHLVFKQRWKTQFLMSSCTSVQPFSKKFCQEQTQRL